ncbi:FecR family protein [Aquiflexum sp.]|uniref:FecR family protein n=1 Tax=Aquiflexum sp. TaxID=1872584 RepID=UPI0035940548
MDISEYTAEDFVLDPEFKKWVLSPNPESNIMWDKLLEKNPAQFNEVKMARKILMNLAVKNHQLSQSESRMLWKSIDQATSTSVETFENEVPLNSGVTLSKYEKIADKGFEFSQFSRVAAILAVVFGLGIIANLIFHSSIPTTPDSQLVVFEEHTTPPGVKSTLTLHDGSKVILNSGSSLRYARNFEADRRALILEGEAYFEVAKDPERPFMVTTGEVVTTALGTSFNISSYTDEELSISLLSGKIAVDLVFDNPTKFLLEKGEGVRVNLKEGKSTKGIFDPDQVIGWTQRKIVFDKVKLNECIRVLENWYGVTFNFKNKPDPGLLLSGKFHDETLTNVLEGLSYSARFEYKIKENTVDIYFK